MLLGGIKSFIPSRTQYSMAESPVDAKYGYSVWLRHVSALAKHGLSGPYPTVAEMGPGNSAVIAACALMCGSESYVALDVLPHLARGQVRSTLASVASLFTSKAPIPVDGPYKSLHPPVTNAAFPDEALRRFRGGTEATELPSGFERDVSDLINGGVGGNTVRWLCPWTSGDLPTGSVDLLFSQAVLQEIPHSSSGGPLREAFRVTNAFLRPGGIASHQIDLGYYGEGPWNVHWTWSDVIWTLVRGKRENFVNREPLGTYLSLAAESGFDVIAADTVNEHGANDKDLAPRFRNLPQSERRARSVHLILRKRT